MLRGERGRPLAFLDTKTFIFEFPKEVARAIALYPQLNDAVFFVETKQQNSPGDFQCYGAAWDRHKNDPARVEQVRKSVVATRETGQARAVRSVTFPDMHYIVQYFPRMSRSALDNVFTLDHELGHQLVPSGFEINSGNELMGESAADAFAALRFMQRFGREAGKDMLAKKSADRLLAPMTSSHYKGDWVHLTASVLLHIVREADISEFEQLTPEETVEMADHFARKYAPTEAQMRKYWDDMRVVTRQPPAGTAATPEDVQAQTAQRGGKDEKYALAMRYMKGEAGVQQNYKKALELFRQAAALGHARSQHLAGFCFRYGKGVPEDMAEAARWYGFAAAQNYAPSQLALGNLYLRGEGVPKDEAKAADWYRRAADQNDANALYDLGRLYHQGKGVAKDEAEWERLCRKAAALGHTQAEYDVSLMCADRDEEAGWLLKAALKGHENAVRTLVMYQKTGIPLKPEVARALASFESVKTDAKR